MATTINPNAASIKDYTLAASTGAFVGLLNSLNPIAGIISGLTSHAVFDNVSSKINELVGRANISDQRVDAAAKFAARFFASVAAATLVMGVLGLGFEVGTAAFATLAVETLPNFYQNVTGFPLIP